MKNLLATLLCVLLIAPQSGFAGGTALSWLPPTQNTDGSAIPATGADALASYRIEYFQCATATTPWPPTPSVAVVPAPAVSHNVTGLASGQRHCFRIAATNNGGVSSQVSATGSALASVSTPAPPTNLQVQTLVAYYVIQQADKFVLLAAGEVAPDTKCNFTQSVNGKYGVPVSAVVKWYGNVRPLVLVGDCVPAA